jgi:Flp pilus assembly pilin Flp
MRSNQLAARFWRDTVGSVLVEYAVVFPLFMLVALVTIDVTSMLYDWVLANKATYVGARAAVVYNPVARNITEDRLLYNASQLKQLGQFCFEFATGTSNGNCPAPSVKVDCSSSECTPDTFGFDSSAFTNDNGTGIFDRMKTIFPRLQPSNVTISYQLNGSGYVGRPGGLPMNVTVSVQNVTHQFYFVTGIMSFFGGKLASAPVIPAFATTLTSEGMATN